MYIVIAAIMDYDYVQDTVHYVFDTEEQALEAQKELSNSYSFVNVYPVNKEYHKPNKFYIGICANIFEDELRIEEYYTYIKFEDIGFRYNREPLFKNNLLVPTFSCVRLTQEECIDWFNEVKTQYNQDKYVYFDYNKYIPIENFDNGPIILPNGNTGRLLNGKLDQVVKPVTMFEGPSCSGMISSTDNLYHYKYDSDIFKSFRWKTR